MIFRVISTFFLVCLLSMSGCSESVTDWERLYRTESEDTGPSLEEEQDGQSEEEDQGTQEKTEEETVTTIQVYVCGAVVHPGVYELPKGARVKQAIDAAGGLTEDADLLLVNQARVVEDGEQIRLYTKDEATNVEVQIEGSSMTSAEAKVNINAADADLLMTLPGIGEAKATAIIEYRESNGDFKTIEDIMNIPGIKNAVFSKIKDKITV